MSSTPPVFQPGTHFVIVDAGVESLRVLAADRAGTALARWSGPASEGFRSKRFPVTIPKEVPVFICGKLSQLAQNYWQTGYTVASTAALWSFLSGSCLGGDKAVVEISASGYNLVGLNSQGRLRNDLLVSNPRCGAGTGINIDRVLEKLNMSRQDVDALLSAYLGKQGREIRKNLPVRADRCGVFATSATVSDKNQGLPLSFALASTLKSEVLKACHHVKDRYDCIWLTGGVFRWEYSREIAVDYFHTLGIDDIRFDDDQSIVTKGLLLLSQRVVNGLSGNSNSTLHAVQRSEHPSLSSIEHELRRNHRFFRETSPPGTKKTCLQKKALFLGIDAGSTMAKVAIAANGDERIVYENAYSNAGDTLETVKRIFTDLKAVSGDRVSITGIGLTGSARYQLQQALSATYPQIADKIIVLVENYAHARGSIDLVRRHVQRLKEVGVESVDDKRCILVDIGGEDTKISTIDLVRGDLLDNAMNTKCSAGTGSLLDTMLALFQIDSIADASDEAHRARRAFGLNATCAVFLLQHARALQAQGVARGEILASAVWAIVENMARSLWKQLDLPGKCVVVLHGQPMQSAPLPVAVSARMQVFLNDTCYGYVPHLPGHRACIGLINTLRAEASGNRGRPESITLSDFIDKQFTKKVITCKGMACGDPTARCSRSLVQGVDANGSRLSIALGGCPAVQAFSDTNRKRKTVSQDLYRDTWHFIRDRLPTSQDKRRLVVPRSFAVSEWAPFFSQLFVPLNIPVHVDTVREADILTGQSHFRIDTCAPHIGAVGQMLRVAGEPHGIILAPQIEFLPVKDSGSLGRTCTINQGGMATARGLATSRHPGARIHIFYLDFKSPDPNFLAHKLYPRLRDVYAYYNHRIEFNRFLELVKRSLDYDRKFKNSAADYAADAAAKALASGDKLALVMGREYVLNPGVFDSHAGRLLREKGYVGIPSYLLDLRCDPEFAHLYWRNAHQIATLASAASQGTLHTVIDHPGLRALFERVEKEEGKMLPLVQVSTFLCGPDSVTNHLVDQLVRQRPYLRIQSDAAIKELAHLENRVNTYVKQLTETGEQRFDDVEGVFDVKLLESAVHREALDPKSDVISFPTLSDNRLLLGLIEAAGFTCVNTYDDDYELTEAIERGRAIAGDAVCAPLAAVYGDVLHAINRFRELRKHHPAYADKRRLLIFNNKGLGPCRQGQYVETHKLFLHQAGACSIENTPESEAIVRFLIGEENKGFRTGFPQWVFLRGVQLVILQGVLHQLWADGVARCRTADQYKAYRNAFGALQQELRQSLSQLVPDRKALQKISRRKTHSIVGGIRKFFAYRFHKNHLVPVIKHFRKTWCDRHQPESPIKIHVDGEAYMRTAQFEKLHDEIISILGLGRAVITHTPVWGFLEYKIAGMMMRSREGIDEATAEMRRAHNEPFRQNRIHFKKEKQKRLLRLEATHFGMRHILAAPLYRAAGIRMPEPMPIVLKTAKAVVSTRRPGGELIPFLGEAVIKLREGYDLVLNVAPEGCMVSSMGEVITPAIRNACPDAQGKVLPLFSQQGDIDREQLELALLKALGPARTYGN